MSKRYEKKTVKPLNFISGGYKVDDALVSQKEVAKKDSDEKIEKSSNGETSDVIITDPPLPSKCNGGNVNEKEQLTKDYASWEVHNKGIGSKLLKKMGHEEGKGLGKSGQGIPLPIEAFRRLGRGTIGSYGSETKDVHSESENKYKLKPWMKDLELKKERYKNDPSWMKDTDKRKDKYRGNNNEPPWLKYKMRQIERNQRAQKGFHKHPRDSVHHSRRDSPPKKAVCMDRGVNMFSRSSSSDVELIPLPGTEIVIREDEVLEVMPEGVLGGIVQSAREHNHRKRKLEEALAKMAREYEELQEEGKKHEAAFATLDQLTELSDKIADYCFKCSTTEEGVTILDAPTTSSSPSTITDLLEGCFTLVEEALRLSKKEGQDVLPATMGFLQPAISTIFKDWSPLQNPDHGMELMREFKYLIETNAHLPPSATTTNSVLSARQGVLDDTLCKFVVSHLREALHEWDINKPHVMLRIFDIWTPLLDIRTRNQLYSTVFNVKLRKGLKNVEQSSENLTALVLPWVPVLGRRLRTLPSHIVQKINFLQQPNVVEILSEED